MRQTTQVVSSERRSRVVRNHAQERCKASAKNKLIIKKKLARSADVLAEAHSIGRQDSRCKKVYSPAYRANVAVSSQPSYRSDEYEPSYSGSDTRLEESNYSSFVDWSVLLKMYQEEHEQKLLIKQLDSVQIEDEHP